MAEPFYVGAYWGPRTESADACAQRLRLCLERLAAAHPLLTGWRLKGESESAALGPPVVTDVEALAAMLRGGRLRTDSGGGVIERLGFRVSLWNGNAVPVSFSTTCGASPATHRVRNFFTLELPAPVGAAAGLYDPGVARSVFHAVVEAWRPWWATFASHSMRAARGADPAGRVGGWMTYVAGGPGRATAEVPGVSVARFLDGVLLVAGADPRQVSDAGLASVVGYLGQI